VYALLITDHTNFYFRIPLARCWLMSGMWCLVIPTLNWSMVNVSHCTKHCTALMRSFMVDTVGSLMFTTRETTQTYLHAMWPKWPPHYPTPVYNTHVGKLTGREVFFTVTFNSLIIPLCTSNITHKQKYLHGEPIILELATRNNKEVYTPINILLIYFSWGTVGIHSQQHKKAISK